MHQEVMDFARKCAERWPEAAKGDVVEVGSFNVNGSPRELHEGCKSYIGIDSRYEEGRGVDLVADGHVGMRALEMKFNDDNPNHETFGFDAVLYFEVAEHDPFADSTIGYGVSYLRPGGYMAMTMASQARGVHGQDDTPCPGYYQFISVPTVNAWIEHAIEDVVDNEPEAEFEYKVNLVRGGQDIQAWVWRKA